jgi:hypothetical protein
MLKSNSKEQSTFWEADSRSASKVPAYHVTRISIIVFTGPRHIPCPKPDESNPQADTIFRIIQF